MSNFIKEWTHKEVELLTRSFRRHSYLVFILKFVLPLTALAMVAILFIYPAMTSKGKKIVLVAQETKTEKTAPVMIKPKFVGMDSNNQPYQITANKAVQEKVNFLTMDNVAADLTMNNGNWVSAVSKNGNYDSIQHQVNLLDDVNMYMVEGGGDIYQAHTKDAFIDMNAGIMKSDDPVYIKSDNGSLHAQSFLLEREKQKITFNGPVHLVILKK